MARLSRIALNSLMAVLATSLAFSAPALHAQDYGVEENIDQDYYYGDDYNYDAEYYGEDLDDLEYEPGEGLHEEEWYDPSDWIDFDEGIEYENDYEYGFYDDEYADDDWFYDYYDYGYDYAY